MKSRVFLRSLTIAATALLLLCGLMLPRIFAQEPPNEQAGQEAQEAPPPGSQVTLELRSGQRPPMKLAVPAFRLGGAMAGAAAATAQEIEAVVRQDLLNSGFFTILGPSELSSLSLSGDIQRDLEAYRSVGSETVLLGDLRAEGDKIVFEGRLFDVASGQAILAKRYRGAFPVGRRIAHTFADEVIRFLTGTQGISLSSLAFTSDRSGNKEIYTMDYDGQNQRRVTGHRSTSMSPAWTPDGNGIGYTSFFNGAPGIYLADLASGRKKPLVTSGSLNMTPTFAPDGQHIAFARSLDGNVEIFTADVNGGNLRRLTHSNAIDANPAWSPKGDNIAFTSGRAGNPHIYMTDAEGTNQRRLTFDGTYNDGASWSPSGDLIAYTSRRDGRFQIVITNVGTLASRVLTSGPGENESPTFSPDGRKIAFVSARGGKKQIYVMDLDGSNLHALTSEGNNDMPDWSRAVPAQ